MKVSIITATYNSGKTLEDTVKSVRSQTHSDIEYIIIDGGSSDNTLEIINRHLDFISIYYSGPDKGIYDAMNRGIYAATGEIVGLLNSDDVFDNPEVLRDVVEAFRVTEADAIYGDLKYVDSNNLSKTVRYWKAGEHKASSFLWGWMPPHPTFYVKHDLYAKYGLFNLTLRSAADYELMLRFIHKHKVKCAYIPKTLVRMRTGGQSNASLKNRIKANIEDRLAWKINSIEPYWFTLYLKPLRKLSQFLRR